MCQQFPFENAELHLRFLALFVISIHVCDEKKVWLKCFLPSFDGVHPATKKVSSKTNGASFSTTEAAAMGTTSASGLTIARVVSTAGLRICGFGVRSRSSDTAVIRVCKTLRFSFNWSDTATIERNLPFRPDHVSRLSRSNSRSRLSPINFCNQHSKT